MARKTFELNTRTQGRIIDINTGKYVTTKIPVVCDRIRHYRQGQGIEQKQLAETLGVNSNAISNWETGRCRPDVNLLPEICKALGITLNQLFMIEDRLQNYTASEQMMMESFRNLSYANQSAVRKLISFLEQSEMMEKLPKMVSLIEIDRRAAAGIGDPTEFDEVGRDIVMISSPVIERSDYVFTVSGESMEPEYHDGDRVLVQKNGHGADLTYGEVGIFMTGNEIYIKEYQPEGLRSLNEEYPMMRFDESQAVYLIGRVMGILEQKDFATKHQAEIFWSMQEG